MPDMVEYPRNGLVRCYAAVDGGYLDHAVEPLLTKLLVSMAFTPISCSRDGPDAWVLRLGFFGLLFEFPSSSRFFSSQPALSLVVFFLSPAVSVTVVSLY